MSGDPKPASASVNDDLCRVGTLDNSLLDICQIKLDGTNYLLWSRSFTLAVTARGMSKFIAGLVTQPTDAGPELEIWKSQNALAMTWLFNSMLPTIRHIFLLLDTPYTVWTTVAQTYSQKGNDAQAFELRTKLRGLDQYNRSLVEYYAELRGVWQELDYYRAFQAVCAADATTFHQMVEKERIYDFLAGLDIEYDPIRVQVLGRVPFPTLGEAYACVQQEESRRSAMVRPSIPDRSALIAIPPPRDGKSSQGQFGDKSGFVDRELLRCDYCNKTRHTREFCRKLHDCPSSGKGNGKGSGKGGGPVRSHAHVLESTGDMLPDPIGTHLQAPMPGPSQSGGVLSQGKLQTLRRLMTKLDSPSATASASTTFSYFAHTGAGYGENDWQW
ncbi:uncharacterized protein LOC131306592 [Rhododendron vialii]|uniref:uncharacterized protein LOC131306592 n=1 Tax=Rhododendron vialii TaxID=182163 RepID=UPI00265FF42A|nr:uncharacterized protein LOC131306592 [Rhododendron vialii]